jgi:hypothetical protein
MNSFDSQYPQGSGIANILGFLQQVNSIQMVAFMLVNVSFITFTIYGELGAQNVIIVHCDGFGSHND